MSNVAKMGLIERIVEPYGITRLLRMPIYYMSVLVSDVWAAVRCIIADSSIIMTCYSVCRYKRQKICIILLSNSAQLMQTL